MNRLAIALPLLLATCGGSPVLAAPALVMKNAIGQHAPAGTYGRITLINCTGCVVDGAEGVVLDPAPGASINDQIVRVTGSKRAVVRNLSIIGKPAVAGVPQSSKVLDKTGNVIGLCTGEGIGVTGSDGAVIERNTIKCFHQGITFGASTDLSIIGNTVAGCRTSPISGGARDRLTISDNVLAGGHAWRWGFTPGDHGDAIHVWTETPLVQQLRISGNRFEQAGGTPILGIFLQAKVAGSRYTGANISGNSITNSNTCGICLYGVSGVAQGNRLIWNKAPTSRGIDKRDAPALSLRAGVRDLTVSGTIGPVSRVAGLVNVTVLP